MATKRRGPGGQRGKTDIRTCLKYYRRHPSMCRSRSGVKNQTNGEGGKTELQKFACTRGGRAGRNRAVTVSACGPFGPPEEAASAPVWSSRGLARRRDHHTQQNRPHTTGNKGPQQKSAVSTQHKCGRAKPSGFRAGLLAHGRG